MSVIRNEVRRATYLDSIVLMRMSREVKALAGVDEAGLIMAKHSEEYKAPHDKNQASYQELMKTLRGGRQEWIQRLQISSSRFPRPVAFRSGDDRGLPLDASTILVADRAAPGCEALRWMLLHPFREPPTRAWISWCGFARG